MSFVNSSEAVLIADTDLIICPAIRKGAVHTLTLANNSTEPVIAVDIRRFDYSIGITTTILPGTTYSRLDMVTYQSGLYLHVTDEANAGVAPDQNGQWMLLAASGAGLEIGDILQTAGQPGSPFLVCDGETDLSADYPDLAVLLADGEPSFSAPDHAADGPTATYIKALEARRENAS